MTSERSVEERLREMARGWTPPEGHRARVLDAAAPLVRGAAAWSDRVWFSRRWRVAAAGVVAAALAVDVAFGAGPSAQIGPHENARNAAAAVDDAARQVGLGADQARLFAQRAFVLASGPDRDEIGGPTGTTSWEAGDIK